MDETLWRLTECPDWGYRTVPRPEGVGADDFAHWPIHAPEVVREAVVNPLRGLWIDHVATGAELVAIDLLLNGTLSEALEDPFVTGGWDRAEDERAFDPHPELLGPQMVMDDAWFDHPEAGEAPLAPEGYEPCSGRSVQDVIVLEYGPGLNTALTTRLPRLWRAGLLRTAAQRKLAASLLAKTPGTVWYRMMLDEGWSVRRAAEVLREAGCCAPGPCQIVNRWARPPPGSPAARSGPPESPEDIEARCEGQLDPGGRWPLERTEEIAKARGYRRVA